MDAGWVENPTVKRLQHLAQQTDDADRGVNSPPRAMRDIVACENGGFKREGGTI
jgi:hypothetical protein